jgi:hypothetical protein
MMGTLKGFPNPPAMGSDEQSSSSPDAIESGAEMRGVFGSPDAIESGASSGKAGLPSLSR